MTFKEISGSVFIGIVTGLASAAGIGGGIIVLPSLIYFFGYSLKHSISICFVTIFAGSIGIFLKRVNERYPSNDPEGVPQIYYNLVIITMPIMLTGAVFGVLVNRVLPDLIIAALFVFVLVTQSLKKTWKKFKNEKEKEENIDII